MYLDRMHTDAINAANKYWLPQTVYRLGKDFNHTSAVSFRFAMLKPEFKQALPIVTWLPANFFN